MQHTSTSADEWSNYAILQVLKRTPTSETHLAVQHHTGAKVILKTADADMASIATRMPSERQAATLPTVHCPGVAVPLDIEVSNGRIHTVRPYIEGISLRECLTNGPLGLTDTLAAGRGVLTALSCLHGQGLTHRDVKPENVIVNHPGPLQSITIVDLAVTSTPFPTQAHGDQSARTLRYMAPELTGILDRSVDGRADLYSVGIALFECLTGRPPFDASGVRDLLRQHLSEPLPPLRSIGVRAPQALEEILRRLTYKDPEDRYHSAEAALADIVALSQALGRGVLEPDIVVGSRDWRQTLTEPALTGRETELATLHRGIADAGAGASRLIILEAESGGGKSRVLDEFCRRAASEGAWVLRGQGIELAAQHPLQVLAGVVTGIAGNRNDIPRIVDRLGDAVGPLCQALPELADVLPGPSNPPMVSEAQARVRTVTALVDLLNALGSAHRPAVVALDDCQWIDELTLQVLQAWCEQTYDDTAEPAHVLVVLAVRPDEGATPQLVAGLSAAERVLLPRLDTEQISKIVASMAGVVPDEAIRAVVELSGGNAFMVSAVLRGLAESGTLRADRHGWRFTPGPGGWQASREAAAILAQRIALLAPATRRLLAAGAVLGRSFDLRLAARLAASGEDHTPAEVSAIVRQAVERHLVWWDGPGVCSFVHDRLRESLIVDLTATERAELHRRAAEQIESTEPSRAFELAYHYDAAGEPMRALGYAMESASSARARHDLELAERQYRIAERGAPHHDAGMRSEIAEALGQILTLRGRYTEAAERFELALSLTSNETDIARLEGQLGEVLFRTDDLEASVRHSEAGLRVLGERIPTGTVMVVVALLWEILRRIMTGGLSRRHSPRAQTTERQLLRSHLYTQLQYPRWFHNRRIDALWLMLRQVNVAERCPQNPELAHSYGVWGGALSVTFPFLARSGRLYVDRSLALSHARRDSRGEGHAASMLTCQLLGAAEYRKAAESAQHAAEMLEQYGDRWEVNFVSRNRALCLYRLGRFREAVEEARRVHRLAIEIGDVNAEVTALEVIAKATNGQVSSAQTQRALRLRGSDLEVTVGAAQAEALRLRHAGRLDEAARYLEDAALETRHAWPSSVYLVPVHSWLATLHRELAERCELPGPRKRALRQALRSAQRATRHARIYPGERPHALREAALVAALAGQSHRARRLVNRSVTAAVAQEAWAELAETRRQCSRLGLPMLASSAIDETSEPETFTDPVKLPTLGLADRFASLLEAGALLASADSPEAITDAVRQTTTSLLRADHCLVVGFGAEDADWSADAPAEWRAGLEVARWVAESKRPIVLSEPFDTEHDVVDSLVLAGIRSLVCAPVIVQDEVAGCILASHSQVGQLFGEEEERLVEFIARLAGAAMERQLLQRQSRIRVINAQEAERARIARDLHDEIGQAFTAVLLQVRLIEDSAADLEGGLRPTLLQHMSELRDLVSTGLRTAQRLAFDLRPAVLDDLGLVAALRRLVVTASGNPSVTVRLEAVELNDGDRLPSDVETTAYRVVQEGLTNVARHSKASECSVVIARQEDRLRVIIEDDGVGFDPGDSHLGLGLRGMTERAELAGGTLKLNSVPGEGTTIVLEVPID
ncbi:AAA family ATPase [Rhodococcus sp. NPDC019627]|uniref:protein kinase domain-containing protein n=1 Tax=unclassified Rhodococcus (in: high G+C Gram-positive bacteria) TaxID=192944 RepID=UPI0033EEB0AA